MVLILETAVRRELTQQVSKKVDRSFLGWQKIKCSRCIDGAKHHVQNLAAIHDNNAPI